jgi:hypothetical protein
MSKAKRHGNREARKPKAAIAPVAAAAIALAAKRELLAMSAPKRKG